MVRQRVNSELESQSIPYDSREVNISHNVMIHWKYMFTNGLYDFEITGIYF